MNAPLLERRSPLGISYALLILTAFFFLMPSGFRAARLSLGQKENEVKDWLPKDFPETAELTWFADHFAGESFVVATWEGCTTGDKRLQLLEQKLRHECVTHDPTGDVPEEMRETYTRARQVGTELGLVLASDEHVDWGGQQEKWLTTPGGQWYYLTPDGRLYRWDGWSGAPAAAGRAIKKTLGKLELDGQFVAAFGEAPVSEIANPFYNDPSLLCAPLFRSVQTGDSIVAELASEGGPLWPIDFTDEAMRPVVAERRAMQRLTGTLFAPAVPVDFAWTPPAFRAAIPKSRRDELPDDFDFLVETTLTQLVDARFDGSLDQLKAASTTAKADAWYEVFDSASVEPPPRMTCVLVTLTDLAKNDLAYALGRGLLGGPRGRLLKLAEESGVHAAAAPSLAPPPFDRPAAKSVAGVPTLRLGGPPVDNMAIDEEGTVTLVRLVGYSVLLGIVLSYFCFRSIKITIMVFIVGGSAAMLSMSMVWWTKGRVDAILLSMPSLVYVLGLSGAIHIVNYYRDEVRHRGQRGAAGRALRHALLPCTLASLTTAIGLISLFTSNLAPISNFGLYSAIGVLMTLGILFSYLPAALETFVPSMGQPAADESGSARKAKKNAKANQKLSPENQNEESWLSEAWASVGRWITAHHALVTSACLLVLVVGSLGLFKIKTSVQLLKLFDSESQIIEDYAWLEANFGKIVPMELVVRMPPSMQSESVSDEPRSDEPRSGPPPLSILERVEAVSRVSKVVRRTLGEPGLHEVGQAMSADTFMQPLPPHSNGYHLARSQYNRELIDGRDELLSSDYMRIEEEGPYAGSELWRVSLRVGALSDTDYGRFISTLRTAVEPVMRAYDTREELMRQLGIDADSGQPAEISGKDVVLVVGQKRPPNLDEIELVSVDDQKIDTENIYLGTLGELLACERIKSPGWLDPAAEGLEVGGKTWNKLLSVADAIVWLGGEGIEESDFEGTARLIDARRIINKDVTPTLAAGGVPDVDGSGSLQVVYTGVIPVVYKAQRTLLTSLAHSIGLAFVLIAGVMIVLLNPGRLPFSMMEPSNVGNGLAAGMVSMIPNIFPVLLVFGVLCHCGVEIDIGTMMTASVAMGVAVDDTIHFLSWFRANLDRGLNRVDAVIETYRRVGPAMTQTTIVGGLGLFVFALSTFTPTQRFGTLMLVMLAAALIGDLILLPALLAGPAGRFFKPRRGSKGDGPPTLTNERQPAEPSPEEPKEPAEPSPKELAESPTQSDREEVVTQKTHTGEKESLPQLRVHYPTDRPKSRRLK